MTEPTTEALLAQIHDLQSRLERLEAAPPPSRSAASVGDDRAPVSRRALLGMAGAGVVGATVLHSAAPAAAADPNDVEKSIPGQATIAETGLSLDTGGAAVTANAFQAQTIEVANTAAALRGVHDGAGPAIEAQSNGTGLGIQVNQASNRSGVRIDQLGTGNSIIAEGTAAQTSANINSIAAGTGEGLKVSHSGSGSGVYSEVTDAGSGAAAVEALTAGTGPAVAGTALISGSAVLGTNSGSGHGVQGLNSGTTSSGVVGLIVGTSTDAAVAGTTPNAGPGVLGTNTGTGPGVRGTTPSAEPAVDGTNTGTGPGVRGTTPSAEPGVDGTNTGTGPGVRGSAGSGTAVLGTATDGYGVAGISDNSVGVVAQGASAPLWLVPDGEAAAAAAPAAGAHEAGELFVDSAGDLYYCTVAGTPGTWTKLNDQVPDEEPAPPVGPVFLAAPERAFDSRIGREPSTTGPGIKGTFAGTETRVIDLNAATSLPGGVTAAIVNVTLANCVGNGFVSIYSADETLSGRPTFSTVNWAETDDTIANTTITAINALGRIKVYASGPCDVIIDVIGSFA